LVAWADAPRPVTGGSACAACASGRAVSRYLRAVPLLLLLACPAVAPDSGVAAIDDDDPRLSEVLVICDASVPAWRVDLHADAWTAGGALWLGVDGAYIEKHPIPSTEAALDGEDDHLELTLGIVSDFRDAALGSKTAFNCGTPGLQGLLGVYSRDGERMTDCRVFGDDPARWEDWEIASCADAVTVRPTAP
jgi:hypothetical protein